MKTLTDAQIREFIELYDNYLWNCDNNSKYPELQILFDELRGNEA